MDGTLKELGKDSIEGTKRIALAKRRAISSKVGVRGERLSDGLYFSKVGSEYIC